jgi:MinD superfamily P-loop ATPase
MRIAVLSGKGGTGKTLVSVNLATVAEKATYIDCDVEEPNGHLFFKPNNIESQDISVKVPYVKQEDCNGCRTCVSFCKYNALAYIGEKVIVFDDVCHSCGGCVLLCPQHAMSEKAKYVGNIKKGTSENVTVITGILNIGVASGVPIISELLKRPLDKGTDFIVIDCPPGSSCAVMESIKDADYCILVAEPTIFGAHNLKMVHDLVRLFGKPYGVVLNKCQDGDNPSERFCIENNINILMKIAFDSELGKFNSNAEIAARVDSKYRDMFTGLLQLVAKEVSHETATSP